MLPPSMLLEEWTPGSFHLECGEIPQQGGADISITPVSKFIQCIVLYSE